jgi:hypothetical protein
MPAVNQRAEWTTTARDRTVAAIKAGRTEEALEGVEAMLKEALPIHDFYGDMCAVFCDFVAERLGEDAVAEAWRFLGERLWRPVFEQMSDAGAETLATVYAMFLRSHRYDFRVTEDDEKFTFHLDYCPSGQRMMLEGKTKGDPRHPLEHGVSTKPHDWTFGKTGVPYYCGHTALWFQLLPAEWGKPIMRTKYGEFDAQGRVAGTPCQTIIYKRVPAPVEQAKP